MDGSLNNDLQVKKISGRIKFLNQTQEYWFSLLKYILLLRFVY